MLFWVHVYASDSVYFCVSLDKCIGILVSICYVILCPSVCTSVVFLCVYANECLCLIRMSRCLCIPQSGCCAAGLGSLRIHNGPVINE